MTDIKDAIQQAMEEIDLPDSLSLDELIARVESYCGKTLLLAPTSGKGWGRTTGLWVEFETEGMILYRTKDPVLYQRHSIYHEIGHILLRHEGCTELHGEIGRNLFRHIGKRQGVSRYMARGYAWNDLEQAAEAIAFILAEKINSEDSTNNLDEVFGQ